uniref:protein-S-isoprenylcysteine alpha-carbonyl methylesterase n=1 Tax=Zea mays TaxID=4577 RepID=A0A804Q7S2_MAIZE
MIGGPQAHPHSSRGSAARPAQASSAARQAATAHGGTDSPSPQLEQGCNLQACKGKLAPATARSQPPLRRQEHHARCQEHRPLRPPARSTYTAPATRAASQSQAPARARASSQAPAASAPVSSPLPVPVQFARQAVSDQAGQPWPLDVYVHSLQVVRQSVLWQGVDDLSHSHRFVVVLEFKLGGVKMENVVSYRWISQLIALLIYAVLLMPGFIKVGYYYFFSRHVIRSVIYGEQPRNRLDLYIPKDNSKSSSVVAFVTGGAWIIGYKAWGALLGRQLAERGIIVACIDYRNFPQGTISDMVSDASEAISFICNNVVSFGGDPNKIYLMGQSAGAHIAACALLEQAIKESKGENTYWNVAQIKAYFGLSGGTIYRTNIDKKVTQADLKLFFESICDRSGDQQDHGLHQV